MSDTIGNVLNQLMKKPRHIELIQNCVAIRWDDGGETFIDMAELRKKSPSAETRGETDLFGRKIGGDPRDDFRGVTVNDFEFVGTYAVRFIFSDGHGSGLYSYEYLREICDESS